MALNKHSHFGHAHSYSHIGEKIKNGIKTGLEIASTAHGMYQIGQGLMGAVSSVAPYFAAAAV